MTIWFDVEDLVHYFRVGNKRISGIQRLSFEIFRAAKSLETRGGPAIGFVRHGTRPLSLIPVAWDDLLADFGGGAPAPPRPIPEPALETISEPIRVIPPIAPPPPPRPSPPRSRPRQWASLAVGGLPPKIRGPLVLAAVMQLQVGLSLGRFGAQAALYPGRRAITGSRAAVRRAIAARAKRTKKPPKTPKPPPSAVATNKAPGAFERLSQPGDTLLVLGAPWNRERYSDLARWLRDERRMRFGVLVHDLVPIRHPEWCHRGVPRMFREWYTDVLPVCDVVFANSRHTAADVTAWTRESGIVLNRAVEVLPIGSGFGAPAIATSMPGLPAPGSYVLFVSTLEARKNHALLFRVWQLLLDEVARGARPAASVPDLVFAGRIGWLVADLLARLDHTDWLGRRIRFVPDPTDTELRALYAGCLFTVFPSWHEGWGLPVTESLAMGKPCIASNAASLPEAGGTLCRYFDPGSVRSARAAVAAVLDDRAGLAAWEIRVRTEYRPVGWAESARALFEAIPKQSRIRN